MWSWLEVSPQHVFTNDRGECEQMSVGESPKSDDKLVWVDEFGQEHSRDIEPMLGGHGDDDYYQLVSFIRRYKGVRPIPFVTPRPIAIDGRFRDWEKVGPEFRDDIGDTLHRAFRQQLDASSAQYGCELLDRLAGL